MARARKPLPIQFKSLYFNTESGKYEIPENGITYLLTFEHYNKLKMGAWETVEAFYADQDKQTKKEIKRTGIQKQEDLFYADPEY